MAGALGGLDRPPRWTQGMRPSVTSRAPAWQEVMFHRLEGQFDQVPTGVTTDASERLLNFAPSVYFYIGRSHPAFGDVVVCYDADGWTDASICPFDTGGLASGIIQLVTAASPADLKNI